MRYVFLLAMLSAWPSAGQRWMRFMATAYSVEGETASGAQTREGRSVAADPSLLPVGTRIEIKGAGSYSGVYTVHDTGPSVKGREVDIFIDNPAEAKKFGRKPVRVRILHRAPEKKSSMSAPGQGTTAERREVAVRKNRGRSA